MSTRDPVMREGVSIRLRMTAAKALTLRRGEKIRRVTNAEVGRT